MIDCKSDSTLLVLEKDYDDFIFILLVGIIIVYYFERSIVKTLFKSFIIGASYLAIDMSCYHIGYFNALVLSLLAGIHLENTYNIVRYYIIQYLIKKKKQIKKILEIEDIEKDDGIKDDDLKDNPNKTK